MARTAEEDRRRLHESRHNIAALNDASALTGDEALQRALTRSVERLSEARGALLDAVLHNLKEHGETGNARVDVERSASAALRQYAFVRSEVSHAFFSVDPDAPLEADESSKRREIFDDVFNETAGPMASLGPARLLDRIDEVAKAMIGSPLLASLDLHARLERAAGALKPKAEAWSREGGEDREATSGLKNARRRFDNEHAGHSDQVRSVLRREDSGLPAGRYVLADDPAYRARRRAGEPLDNEPGIVDVEEEIEPTTEG